MVKIKLLEVELQNVVKIAAHAEKDFSKFLEKV